MLNKLLLQRNVKTGELLALPINSVAVNKLFQLSVDAPTTSLILNHNSETFSIIINCFDSNGIMVSPQIMYSKNEVTLIFNTEFTGIINLLYRALPQPSLSGNFPTATEGSAYIGQVYGLSGFLPYTFECMTALPEGLIFNTINGTVSGTPQNGTTGQINITYKITDFYGSSSEKSFTINILEGVSGRLTKSGHRRKTKAGNVRIT